MDDYNDAVLKDFISQLSQFSSSESIAEYSSPESPNCFMNIGGGDNVARDADATYTTSANTNSCNNVENIHVPDFSYSTEMDVMCRETESASQSIILDMNSPPLFNNDPCVQYSTSAIHIWRQKT